MPMISQMVNSASTEQYIHPQAFSKCNSHVKVYTHPEHSDKVEAFYQQSTKLAQSEPGTVMYCLGRDSKDPTIFYFFERYASKEAFKNHVTPKAQQDFIKSGWMKDVKAVFVKPILPAE
jgi:quinol monooxygenase YgiN